MHRQEVALTCDKAKRGRKREAALPADSPDGSGAKASRQGPAKVRVGGRCPLCGAVTTPRYRPFCSRHCADYDLMNWLGGRYRIASSNDASAGSGLAGDGQGDDE